MPLVRVGPCGSAGVNQDLSSHELPNEAWTDARNMRVIDGSVAQFGGHGEIYAGAPVAPFHVLPVYVGSDRYWLYASAAKIYAVSGATGSVVHSNITRQTGGVDVDYAGVRNGWTSTSLSGIPIFNPGNAVDPPQQWDLNPAHRCTALSNWPAGAFCKSLRAYKNQLVALNVTKGGVNFPFMVKWSHPADPGAVPISWDEADPTLDAGEVDLAEGGDPIIDGLQLGGTFVIYKEQSVWRMDYTGGVFVEQFTKVLGTSGAMNRNCIVEIDGFHVVLTNNDVIVHDGQSASSVLDKQSRRALFQSIDAQNTDKCFLFKNPFLNEVFVCYPEAGSTVPNLALVWNYKDRTVTFREIPNLNHAAFGPVENGVSQPWSGDSAPWAADVSNWNASEFTPDAARALMASNDQKLFLLDSSTTFDGAIPEAWIERRGLSFGAPDKIKLVRGVRPRVSGVPGEKIKVKVGFAEDPYQDPTYTEMPYTIGSEVACDCFVTGRYIAVRFESDTAYQWRLDSYDVDVKTVGNW